MLEVQTEVVKLWCYTAAWCVQRVCALTFPFATLHWSNFVPSSISADNLYAGKQFPFHKRLLYACGVDDPTCEIVLLLCSGTTL